MRATWLLLLTACDGGTTSTTQVIAECLCDDAALPTPMEVTPDPSCWASAGGGALDPEVAWAWTGNGHPQDQVMVTPVASPLVDDDGDGLVTDADVPRVAFTSMASDASLFGGAGALVVLRGDTGEEELFLPVLLGTDGAPIDRPAAAAGVAIGDLEGDGHPDLCVVAVEAAVICLEGDGTFKWKGAYHGPLPAAEWQGHQVYPAIADMDGDGDAEVIVGNHIFDSDGTLQGLGARGSGHSHPKGGMPVVMDMDADGYLDVAVGNAVYDRFGATIREMPANFRDSPIGVADLNLDGSPEIVATKTGFVVIEADSSVSVNWTHDGEQTRAGAPVIVDVDGDGVPETGVPAGERFVLMNADGTVRWEVPTNDPSDQTGASATDLDGDGVPELLYADEERFYVLDGLTGADRLTDLATDFDPTDHASGTWHEYPVPVDLDRDGSQEILLASNRIFDGHAEGDWTGLRAIRSASRSWMPARPVWNQHTYHLDPVQDDGSIAPTFAPSFLTHDSFHATAMTDGQRADLFLGTPTTCELACDYAAAGYFVSVGNAGLAAAGAFSVTASIAGEAVATRSHAGLASGESAILGPFTVPVEPWSGELTFTIDAPDVAQCDLSNDTALVTTDPCP